MIKTKILEKALGITLKNKIGTFNIGAYSVQVRGKKESVFIVYKNLSSENVNLRINSACFTGDIFSDLRCDCSWQLQEAMKLIHKEDNGLIIYFMNHEGRGIGIVNKLKSYALMEKGLTTYKAFKELGFQADYRDYSAAGLILRDLKIKNVKLITNNFEKIQAVEKLGIQVEKRIPTVSQDNKLKAYLLSKKKEMGHIIEV